MELLIPLYIWCAVWWGVFCVLMHKQTRGSIIFSKMAVVFLLNTVGMPISLIIATWNTAKKVNKIG